MGDYSILPAKVLRTGQELHQLIDENKEKFLGRNVMEIFDAQLPYLPKVSTSTTKVRLQRRWFAARFYQSRRIFPSRFIRIKIFRFDCMPRTLINSQMTVMSPRLPLRLVHSRYSPGSSQIKISRPCSMH